jgi:hypothetical protein
MPPAARRARIALVVLIGLLWLHSLPRAGAQEPTPEPGAIATSLLPGSTLLGSGWVVDTTVSPDTLRPKSFALSPDVFREGAARIYVGPAGGRVLIVALLLTESRVAVRQSWEVASELLALVADDGATDAQRTERLATLPPPAGCVEAKRVEGVENMVLQPFGASMCAVDPDRIYLVAAHGPWQRVTGVAASDAIVELGAAATPATPAA